MILFVATFLNFTQSIFSGESLRLSVRLSVRIQFLSSPFKSTLSVRRPVGGDWVAPSTVAPLSIRCIAATCNYSLTCRRGCIAATHLCTDWLSLHDGVAPTPLPRNHLALGFKIYSLIVDQRISSNMHFTVTFLYFLKRCFCIIRFGDICLYVCLTVCL